jgi:hypothetical protein
MPTYAICRIQKIKSWGELGSSSLHTTRERDTPNADPSIKNIRVIGNADDIYLETLFKEKIGGQKIRSNAVLGIEMLLSASPQYFRPENPSQASTYNQDLLDNFVEASSKWLLERYNDRVVRAELHLDEVTPHIHAYIVPLDNHGKLNCRALFNGRQKLSQMQDSFANAVAHLGIERGIKGSRAKHTNIKKYYAQVNQQTFNLDIKEILPQPQQNQNAVTYLEQVQESLQPTLNNVNYQLADRKRILSEKEQLALTALASERERQSLEKRILELELEVAQLKAQADLLRDLPLDDVAYELGLFPDKKGQNRWKGEGHIISIVDSKFYDFGTYQKGGGGAIDLVMHVNRCNFKNAIKWLAEHFSSTQLTKALTHHIRSQVENISKYDLNSPFKPPLSDETHWPDVHNYLTSQRKIPEYLINILHTNGLIYADKNANAVFIMRNLAGENTGAFLRGTQGRDNTFVGFAIGTKRTAGWFHLTIGGQTRDEISRAVIVKSPIEVLSIATLLPPEEKTLYLSADSVLSIPTSEFFTKIPTIVAAYDNDATADEIAKQIKEVLPHAKRLRPKTKDWNEQLIQQLNF